MINDKDRVGSRFPVGTFVARPCVGVPSGKDDTLKQTREKIVRALFGIFDAMHKNAKVYREIGMQGTHAGYSLRYINVCDIKTGRGYVKKNRR